MYKNIFFSYFFISILIYIKSVYPYNSFAKPVNCYSNSGYLYNIYNVFIFLVILTIAHWDIEFHPTSLATLKMNNKSSL